MESFDRIGCWRDVIGFLPDTKLKAQLFTLIWRHPEDNGTYYYAIRPVADDGTKTDFIRLRTTSADIHAVLDRATRRGMAAFYCAGSVFLPDGTKLDRPSTGIIHFSINPDRQE